MEKKYEEIIEKRLVSIVSSDGQYSRYVKNMDVNSEEYAQALRDVENYENSAKALLCSEVMAIPHVVYACDTYIAGALGLDATNCGEDEYYLFHITKREQIEAIFKLGVLTNGGTPSVGKRVVEVTHNSDGTPREHVYSSRYSDSNAVRHEDVFDPDYFVGHDVLVLNNYDNEWNIIYGTLDDIEADRKALQKKALDELKAEIKKSENK